MRMWALMMALFLGLGTWELDMFKVRSRQSLEVAGIGAGTEGTAKVMDDPIGPPPPR